MHGIVSEKCNAGIDLNDEYFLMYQRCIDNFDKDDPGHKEVCLEKYLSMLQSQKTKS